MKRRKNLFKVSTEKFLDRKAARDALAATVMPPATTHLLRVTATLDVRTNTLALSETFTPFVADFGPDFTAAMALETGR